MGTNGVYNNAKRAIALKQIGLDSDDIRVMLVSSAYTFDPAHRVVSDVIGEVTGAGYFRKALEGKQVVIDSTNNVARWKAQSIVWSSVALDQVVDAAILFVRAANDTISQLICCVDSIEKVSAFGVNLSFRWHAVNGIMVLG